MLTIGGRDYGIACAPGEEARIAMLGAAIDARIAALPGGAKQGEARCLLYAALLLADELHEARAGAVPPLPANSTLAAHGALAAIAQRLENIAAHLEEAGQSA